jgi:hypothetical protein
MPPVPQVPPTPSAPQHRPGLTDASDATDTDLHLDPDRRFRGHHGDLGDLQAPPGGKLFAIRDRLVVHGRAHYLRAGHDTDEACPYDQQHAARDHDTEPERLPDRVALRARVARAVLQPHGFSLAS